MVPGAKAKVQAALLTQQAEARFEAVLWIRRFGIDFSVLEPGLCFSDYMSCWQATCGCWHAALIVGTSLLKRYSEYAGGVGSGDSSGGCAAVPANLG